MVHVKIVLFSLCIATCFYVLTISSLGAVASIEFGSNNLLTSITKDIIGIGLAALIPAFLVHSYEPSKKWVTIALVIVVSMFFQGNVNYMPMDPRGFVRFLENTLISGDFRAVGIFLEIVLLPIVWLFAFKHLKI